MVAEGAPNEELEAASSGLIGESDLLIVGPGVLGRLVAEKWRQVLFGQRNHLVTNGCFFIILVQFINLILNNGTSIDGLS